ncbi:MAG: XRE family transcriptional regulator [Coriobacteriales bacterium]|jgi:transcriptional regulator with XRE-family HTH domain|nr:XRE family transcriptional regulator [Coriobacteriales bacterium]
MPEKSKHPLAVADVSDDRFADLAERIAGIRDASGYSQETFADMLGVSREAYKQYEETGYDVPASLLMQIARICKIDMAELITGEEPHITHVQIVRGGEGKSVGRLPGYHYQDLAFKYSDKEMQPLYVTLLPGEEPAELASHPGQEFDYVTKGVVNLVFEHRQIELRAGDSAYFDGNLLHAERCLGDEAAEFIAVITD